MARVEIDGDDMVVQLSSLERIVTLRQGLRVPIRSIVGVTVDSGVGAEPKGIRSPGTHVPGLLTSGTYLRDGVKTFWHITRGTRAVVISLKDADVHRVIVDVTDPHGVAAQINRARASQA
jgi:hypothetical protein